MTIKLLRINDTAAIFLMIFVCSCQLAKNGIQSTGNESEVLDDTFFKNFVQHVDSTGLHFSNKRYLNQLRIEPRLIKPAYIKNKSLKTAHLESTDSVLKHQRVTYLKSLDIEPADVIRDKKCVGVGGMPPPPSHSDSVYTMEEQTSHYPPYCREQGFFLTVVFSYPAEVQDAECQTLNTGLNSLEACYEIRAHELTSYSKYYFTILAVQIRTDENSWKIIGIKNKNGWMS